MPGRCARVDLALALDAVDRDHECGFEPGRLDEEAVALFFLRSDEIVAESSPFFAMSFVVVSISWRIDACA